MRFRMRLLTTSMSNTATPRKRGHPANARLANTHTPHGHASYSINANQVTTSHQAQQYVRTEMKNSVYGKHPDFIDTMFDKISDDDCQKIFNTLQEKKLWTPEFQTTKRKGRKTKTITMPAHWTNLSRQPRDEKSLYAPLVKIMNSITELTEKKTHDGVRLV
ncbi:hypothetical protein C8Q75DRAFT_618296 [Abortiporus biennis]|nr:hypothetical protein C8Q75DRAFT_618296 [Abortiporus biennis]